MGETRKRTKASSQNGASIVKSLVDVRTVFLPHRGTSEIFLKMFRIKLAIFDYLDSETNKSSFFIHQSCA